MQRLWAVGAVRPRQPPVADRRQVPCPSTAAVRTVPAGAARSCALLCTGPRGASRGSGGGGGLIKGLADMVGTPRATSQAPLRGTGTAGGGPPPVAGLPHAQPAGSVQRTLPWVGSTPPPHPGSSGRPGRGGGAPDTGREPQWIGADGSGRVAELPPPPSAGAPGDGTTHHGGGTRCTPPRVRRFFRDFARANRVTGAATARLPPSCHAGEGEGRGTGDAPGDASAHPPLPPPPPLLALQEVAEVKPACGAGTGAPAPAGDAPQAPVSDDPNSTPAAAGAARGAEEGGATAPHADPVRCAQGPRLQVLPGAQGGVALLLSAPRGAPSAGASGRWCATAHALWDGRRVRALPPPPQGRGAMTTRRRRPHRGRAPPQHPQGVLGARDEGHGRAEGADT